MRQGNKVMEEGNKQTISLKKIQSIRTDENCTCYYVFTKTLALLLSDNYNLRGTGRKVLLNIVIVCVIGESDRSY